MSEDTSSSSSSDSEGFDAQVSCNSSPFEDGSDEENRGIDEGQANLGNQPYQFEPLANPIAAGVPQQQPEEEFADQLNIDVNEWFV